MHQRYSKKDSRNFCFSPKKDSKSFVFLAQINAVLLQWIKIAADGKL
jgi:hypothetical protein